MTKGQLVPLAFVRPPYADELISSWLNRIACIYNGTWWQLDLVMPLDAAYPLNSDYGGESSQFDILGMLTRTDPGVIQRLDLAYRYPGQPISRFQCHPKTRLAVPDFCAVCFTEDRVAGSDNYFRQEWALAGVSHCQKHGVLLGSDCGNCGYDLTYRMALRAGVVQVYCIHCLSALAHPSGSFDRAEAPFRSELISFEADMIAACRGAGSLAKLPFEILEDIAFLLFYCGLPKSAGRIKSGLGVWGQPEDSQLTHAMLRSQRIHDASYIYPLAVVHARYRWRIMVAAIALLHRRDQMNLFVPHLDAPPDSLDALFRTLDDYGREEMVARADAWPPSLREEVSLAMSQPRSTNPMSRLYNREPWDKSWLRERANGGIIPNYSNL